MAYKIATEQYAYNIGVGKGSPTSNLMVTYSRAIALGCQIRNNSYSNTQLVRQEDLWSCSCQGATGSYNDCGSNCTCNTCNSNNSYSWTCSCNSCNTDNSYTWTCSCNSCNSDNSYSYTCNCNSCNNDKSYCSCVAITPIYCKCNSHSGTKKGSCSCNSNVTPTTKGCSCVTGISKYCSNNWYEATDSNCNNDYISYTYCTTFYHASCSPQTWYDSSYTASPHYLYSKCYKSSSSSYCHNTAYAKSYSNSATCGSNRCSGNGACSSVACACNTCNTDSTCSSKTVTCTQNCGTHTNSATCGSNNEYTACTCYTNTKNATGTCKCNTNTSSGTSSCTCHSNTKTGTSSCTCYNNVKCSCNGNWVTCTSKNYKAGTNS